MNARGCDKAGNKSSNDYVIMSLAYFSLNVKSIIVTDKG